MTTVCITTPYHWIEWIVYCKVYIRMIPPQYYWYFCWYPVLYPGEAKMRNKDFWSRKQHNGSSKSLNQTNLRYEVWNTNWTTVPLHRTWVQHFYALKMYITWLSILLCFWNYWHPIIHNFHFISSTWTLIQTIQVVEFFMHLRKVNKSD